MATEHTNANAAIAQAVAEATRTAIQAMAVARAERTQNAGPKLGRPIMKQPTFDWISSDKYVELKSFKLEAKNISKIWYKQSRKSAHYQKLARQTRPTTIKNLPVRQRRSI